MTYDSTEDTRAHIKQVEEFLGRIVEEIAFRALFHDRSKLQEPEKSLFDKYTPLLRSLTYGSEEYKKVTEQMGPALAHHYENNPHHPEYYPIPDDPEIAKIRLRIDQLEDGDPAREWLLSYLKERQSRINGMNLIDVLEMLADWKAAGMRHSDGSIEKSLEINRKRFGISDQLFRILSNTVRGLEW